MTVALPFQISWNYILGRLYVMNIECIFSNYIIPACKLQNLWQVGEKNWSASGLPLFTLRRLHQCGFFFMEPFFCECTFFTAGLEALVYSAAVCFSREMGSCCRSSCWGNKKEIWLDHYKSHRFSSEALVVLWVIQSGNSVKAFISWLNLG